MARNSGVYNWGNAIQDAYNALRASGQGVRQATDLMRQGLASTLDMDTAPYGTVDTGQIATSAGGTFTQPRSSRMQSLLAGMVPGSAGAGETIDTNNSTLNDLIPNATDTTVSEVITETPNSDIVQLDDDTVEYTYKEGDTFGQVIKDLGFMTDNGLWGNNGDVKYYEKQLRDQGWEGGNIPVGAKIRLRRRPAVQYDIYGNRVK